METTDTFAGPELTKHEILAGPNAPIIVFDGVALAFDEKVILNDVSFTLLKGHTKIFLGASGAGKSTISSSFSGCWKPDAGVIWVNGERVDEMNEREMMTVRADLGMVFQEGALFDSSPWPRTSATSCTRSCGGPRTRSTPGRARGAGLHRPRRVHRPDAVGSRAGSAGVAIARAMAAKPRILYDEPTTGLDPITATTVDEEIVKLRDIEVSSIVVTHQLRDAFFVAGHRALRTNGAVQIELADQQKSEEAEFIMLKDGGIIFEGPAGELKRRPIPT